MAFKLPNQADLTIEQTEIINLPTNKNFVIQGGPGTGKTVMAIYRAGQMPRNARVLVLVYNRPLCEFIKTGIKDSDFGPSKSIPFILGRVDSSPMYWAKMFPEIQPIVPITIGTVFMSV